MTDRADLIRRLNEAADEEMTFAKTCSDPDLWRWEKHYTERAALLREAKKALEGGE